MTPAAFSRRKQSKEKSAYSPSPPKHIDDQIQVARFMNMLNRYFGNDVYRDMRRMRCVT